MGNLIELNNKLIATGTLLYEYKFIHNISKISHIEDICFDNNYRGKNYGKILVNYLIDEAKKKIVIKLRYIVKKI